VRFEPRGCGQSDWDGSYDLATSLADADALRAELGYARWLVGGHSHGVCLALAYSLAYPGRALGLLGLCGGSLLNDRDWSRVYHERLKAEGEDDGGISFHADPEANRIGVLSWREYIKRPTLLRELSQLDIPACFIVAGNDIRPNWPIQQTAALLPHGRYHEIAGAGHYVWLSHAAKLQAAIVQALDGM
jgi:proline iminopeptidase